MNGELSQETAQFLRSSSKGNRACARPFPCAPRIGKVTASLQPPAAAVRWRQDSGEQTVCSRYPSTVCYKDKPAKHVDPDRTQKPVEFLNLRFRERSACPISGGRSTRMPNQ
jgi:hypothetical protein